jgi:hypothetical protein
VRQAVLEAARALDPGNSDVQQAMHETKKERTQQVLSRPFRDTRTHPIARSLARSLPAFCPPTITDSSGCVLASPGMRMPSCLVRARVCAPTVRARCHVRHARAHAESPRAGGGGGGGYGEQLREKPTAAAVAARLELERRRRERTRWEV